MEEILTQAKEQMEEAVELLASDLKTVKTGRAKPSLIEDLTVKAYNDQSMTLKELASISASDPHCLVVSPWDKNILKDIEKAIAVSELQLSPVIDGDLIRVKIPPLTEETRRDLVKLVNQKIESGRQLIRQVRNESKKEIEDLEGQSGVSEDDLHRWLEELQQLVDQYSQKLEDLGQQKEKELMAV